MKRSILEPYAREGSGGGLKQWVVLFTLREKPPESNKEPTAALIIFNVQPNIKLSHYNYFIYIEGWTRLKKKSESPGIKSGHHAGAWFTTNRIYCTVCNKTLKFQQDNINQNIFPLILLLIHLILLLWCIYAVVVLICMRFFMNNSSFPLFTFWINWFKWLGGRNGLCGVLGGWLF